MTLRRRLTLIELVVVLAILAATAGVALRATDGLAQQARFETTGRTLGELETAIAGPRAAHQPDGTLVGSGFVADLGRLPRAVGADPRTQLAELWSNPLGLPAYAIRTSDLDAAVRLGVGWRGPYLRLPPGASGLRDAWGYPFELESPSAAAAADGEEVARVRSLGADHGADETGWNLAQQTQLPAPAATLTGLVQQADGSDPAPGDGDTILVVLFEPRSDGSQPDAIGEVTSPPLTTGGSVGWTLATTAGPRVLRAYQGTALTLATLATATRRSAVVRWVVPPGGGDGPTLLLQAP